MDWEDGEGVFSLVISWLPTATLKFDVLSSTWSEQSPVLAFISILNWILVLYKWSWPQCIWQRDVCWKAACPHIPHMPLQTKRKWKKYTVGHTVHTWLMEGQFKDKSFFQQWKHILRRAHCIFCLYNTGLRICQAVHNWAEHVIFVLFLNLFCFLEKWQQLPRRGMVS